MKMKPYHMLAWVLLVIGGLNWGLVGLFKYDAVGEIFGFGSGLARLIYSAVGIATVYLLVVKMPKMAK